MKRKRKKSLPKSNTTKVRVRVKRKTRSEIRKEEELEQIDDALFQDSFESRVDNLRFSLKLPWTHLKVGNLKYFEPIENSGVKVLLPIELLQNPSLFYKIFSMNSWNNFLSEKERKFLCTFLPYEISKNNIERKQLLADLFTQKGDFNFSNPVNDLIKSILKGELHPFVYKQISYVNSLREKNGSIEYKLKFNNNIVECSNIDKNKEDKMEIS